MKKQDLDRAVKYIDSWLRFNYEQEDIPGFAVGIAHRGKMIFSKAYGYADVEQKIPLTTGHLFRVASHSKSFTAMALMQLQEQRKLRIDDCVVDYLPWLKEHTDTRWQNVTLRQLMSHGAGVTREGRNANHWQLESPYYNADELKSEIMASNLIIDNNRQLKYSNVGYGLLGIVIEAVSRQSYNQYVETNIIDVLNLGNTYPEYSNLLHERLVTGYSYRDANKTRLPISREVETRALASATGLCSTVNDLCRFFSVFSLGGESILSDESKKEMQRMQYQAHGPYRDRDDGYGLGLEVGRLNDRPWFGHSGGFPGQSTRSMYFPKDEIAITVLTNCMNGPATAITKGVAGVIDFYKMNAQIEPLSSSMRKLEGRYLSLEGMIDVVAVKNTIVVTYPNGWYPLQKPNKLEKINDTIYKFNEVDSYDAEGEVLSFNLNAAGQVETVIDAGITMWPEQEWAKKQASRKIVELARK